MPDKQAEFPCPQCGQGRGEVDAICAKCGWEPGPTTIEHLPPTEARSNCLGWFGLAIIIPSLFLMTPWAMAFGAILGLNNHDATPLERLVILICLLGPYVGFAGVIVGLAISLYGFSNVRP